MKASQSPGVPQWRGHQDFDLQVLSYLDFFQTGVQRVAVATAAHMCRGLSSDSTDAVTTAIPILNQLLQYSVCYFLD